MGHTSYSDRSDSLGVGAPDYEITNSISTSLRASSEQDVEYDATHLLVTRGRPIPAP